MESETGNIYFKELREKIQLNLLEASNDFDNVENFSNWDVE